MSAIAAVRTLSAWELRAALRTRWTLAIGAVFAAACVALTMFGLRSLRSLGLAGGSAAVEALLVVGILLPPLLGLLLGASSIAGARERGMLALLGAQPVPRASLAVSATLGAAGAVWCVVGMGFGAAALVLAGVAGTADLGAFLGVLGAVLAAGGAAAAVGVALSALSRTRLQATAAAVTAWFLLAFGFDLAIVIVGPSAGLGPAGLLVAVLANPLEAARIFALLAAAPDGASLGPLGSLLVDRFGAGRSFALLGATLAAWTAAPLTLASLALRRRDL